MRHYTAYPAFFARIMRLYGFNYRKMYKLYMKAFYKQQH